jgi:tryptophan halogenase
LSPAPSFSQISAFRAGWFGIYPLASRTALLAAYSTDETDDQEALRLVAEVSGLRIAGNLSATDYRPGARRQQWIGNCVAIGESAVNLGPLDAVQMHALHTGISYLVSLFPVDAESFAEATVFNEKMASHTVGMRDFQIAHFKLNERFDEPFWDKARDRDVPESLAEKMRLFAARGIVAMNENETFQEDNWTAILNGHRLLPETWNPLVDRVPEQEQIETFQTILKFVAAEADKMPTMQSYLELNAPQATGNYAF